MMHKFVIPAVIPLIFLGGHASADMGKLYNVSASPYAADIARKAGDLVTVVVDESASTEDSGSSIINKKDDKKFSLGKLFFPSFKLNEGLAGKDPGGDPLGTNLNSEDKFDSKAGNSSTHSFKTRLQMRIVEEISKGQFVIRGHRDVALNGKTKTIFITGIIRQADISTANEIASHLIADATIEIDGEIVAKDLKPGFFSKIFSTVLF